MTHTRLVTGIGYGYAIYRLSKRLWLVNGQSSKTGASLRYVTDSYDDASEVGERFAEVCRA